MENGLQGVTDRYDFAREMRRIKFLSLRFSTLYGQRARANQRRGQLVFKLKTRRCDSTMDLLMSPLGQAGQQTCHRAAQLSGDSAATRPERERWKRVISISWIVGIGEGAAAVNALRHHPPRCSARAKRSQRPAITPSA
jgi:hypothetical protein